MSGQPERCYAVEELKSLQSSIADLTQSMVIQRARVEKYKDTDLAAARDNFSLLQAVRRKLAEAIGKARLNRRRPAPADGGGGVPKRQDGGYAPGGPASV